MKSEKKCIDDFLTLGRYGFITILLIELVMIIVCGNFLFMVFGGADVKITQCDTEIPSNFTNSSTDFCASFEQQQCTSLTLDYEFYSINAEWLLICDEGQLVKQSTSYQMLGLIIGSVFWGRIADLYGRKVPMIICLIFCGSFGFASAFSPNLIVFTALRTIVSFFTIGAGVIANTFYGELLPSKHRLWLAFLLSWSPNFVIVAAIAYFTQTWRLLIVFISSISVPATLLIWYMSETPHFLMRRGKLTKAILTIQRFYRIDGKEVDMVKLKEVFFEEQKMDMENNEKSYSFLHLFCTPKFIGYSIALCFCCFELSIISYSMLFNLDKVSGSL
ncbi:unnamed protein product, partial [Mesorhabditis belari]|uniref:Uncharacterized protein n=1 Tax=Mesorhabditis belari TaxID=2138241 RepID=A0AAF3ECJ1_9BILA